ncbi:MAG: hypothetical protein LBG74_04095 [Spirochaetaceae bacterium]|jgi:hypothetical protein|nr:hypothetical protein [Spirochaetaceae bacterium]
MKTDTEIETLITQVCSSAKTRKLLSTIAVLGMAVCLLPLLPPVQQAILKLVMAHRSLNIQAQGRFLTLLSLPLIGFAACALLFCCIFSRKIDAVLENQKYDGLFSKIALGITALLLVFITIFSYQHGRQWLSSDHASEMVLAKLLAEENALVSRNWHYSTEIRLVYQTLFSMPLFKLLGNGNNWALIRAITVLLNNIILIASYIFLMKQTKIKNKWIYITALFLPLPISFEYWDIVIFGGYYVFFIAQLFCCLGLFLKLLESSSQGGANTKSWKVCFILFGLLSLVLGAQGIRALLCVHIPLMLACFFAARFGARKKRPLVLGAYGFISCGIGFLVNYMLHIKYSFHSFENMRLDNLYQNFSIKIGQNLSGLVEFFGYAPGESLLSAKGIFGTLALFFTLWVIFQAVTLSRDNASAQKQYTALFFICAAAFNMFVYQIIDGEVTARYFIPFLILYASITGFLLEQTGQSRLYRTALAASVFLFIFGQSFLNFQTLEKRDINSGRTGYISYLAKNNLTYGFATFWNANVTTELSNGAIELAGLEPDGLMADKNMFKIQGWLNKVKLYEPSYFAGESFLFLTKDEWELARKTGRPFTQKQPDYNDGAFVILRYPSAQIIHEEVLDGQ